MINLDEYIELLSDERSKTIEEYGSEYQTLLFEKYILSGADHIQHRQSLFKEYKENKDNLIGKNGLRKRLAAIDLSYFARAYLPHYFVRDSPEFHKELDNIYFEGVLKGLNPISDKKTIETSKGCRRAVAAPRGHAKSTNFTFKDSLHATLYEYKHYIFILSDSSEQAEGFINDIRSELEENPHIIEDFGKLEGKVWKNNVLLTTTGIKIEGVGSGKKVRGRRHRNWRPDLIILDDVENDENVNTPEQRKKLANWFYKAVSKMGDTYTDIVFIGTMLHYDSLLAKVLKNPSYHSLKYQGVISWATNEGIWEQWKLIYCDLDNKLREQDALDFYTINKEEMDEGTEVLWEEKLSYYDLMVIKISEGDASFNSEIQNEPLDPDSCLFNEEWFDFYNEAELDFSDRRFVIVASNDPSLGKNKKSDTSAIISIAKDTKTGYMYVLDASIERRKPDIIIEDAINMDMRYRKDYKKPISKFGVETVQFQYYFKEIMAQRSAEAGIYLAIEEINSTTNKQARIESLQPFIKNKFIKFNDKHKTLLQQLKEYPMGKNDDAPDALEMAVKLAISIKGSTLADYKSIISRAMKFRKGSY